MDKIQFTDYDWQDFSNWLNKDRKTLKRILNLLEDIKRNDYKNIGKPEPLLD